MRLLTTALVLIGCLFASERANAFASLDITIARWVDADTFDFFGPLTPDLMLSGRVRLMCINAPETRTDAGRELIEHLGTLGIISGRIDIVDQDAFGRYLVWFWPRGWVVSFNQYLFENGSPYYGGLTRKSLEECKKRFGDFAE